MRRERTASLPSPARRRPAARRAAAALLFVLAVAAPRASTAAGCVCDCDGNGEVSIDEVVRAVGIGLDALPLDGCPAADANGDSRVTIDEVVRGVDAGVRGCPAATATPVAPTPTPSPSPTPQPTSPCVDIGGTWTYDEKGTFICQSSGTTQTTPVDGSATIVITQDVCDVSYDVPGVSLNREGTVDGDLVTFSGMLIVPPSGVSISANTFTAQGRVAGDRIELEGTGSAVGSSSAGNFTCAATTRAVFLRQAP